MNIILKATLTVTLILAALAIPSTAYALDPTDVAKWSQKPGEPMPGTNMGPGEDIWSDVDWRAIMTAGSPFPNWTIADDFRSDGRPITAVRWWGSYPTPGFEPTPIVDDAGNIVGYAPVIEDGFLLSFFSDLPTLDPPIRPPMPGAPFSSPGELLGSYVAPVAAVTITPLDFVGWDGHRVWQYEACLKDMHLDHPSHLATDDSFDEVAGTIYWLSIVAENGHKIERTATGDWVANDTGDPMLDIHYWGWHTSPDAFQDVAVMGSLFMPGNEWIYQNWQPIHPQHGLYDMAFELLTPVPEPSTLALGAVGLAAFAGVAIRRRRR